MQRVICELIVAFLMWNSKFEIRNSEFECRGAKMRRYIAVFSIWIYSWVWASPYLTIVALI